MVRLSDKLSVCGAAALSDEELLQLVLGEDFAQDDVAALLAQSQGRVEMLLREDFARLRMKCGLGAARAARLVASAELGRRVAARDGAAMEQVSSDEDVARLFAARLHGLKHEECWAVYLTSTNRVLELSLASRGGVQGTVVDVKIVLKRALELLATQLIIVHNHPSGAASPSQGDKNLTRKIAESLALLDIKLTDHVIISDEGHYSFRRNGLLG